MRNQQLIGLYGKLPAHGDFVSRNLPPAFINYWDEWLQRFIASSQEQLGEEWLTIYLTSPIWRFVLSKGVVDDNKWAGIMLPSVDRVGRYFPISVAAKLPPDTNIVDVLSSQTHWFGEIEDIALKGLEGIFDVDGVFNEIQQKPMPLQPASYVRNTGQGSSAMDSMTEAGLSTHMAIQMDFEEQLPSSINSYVLEWFISQHLPSYSLWHASGSERVPPSFLVSQGLPAVRGAAAMLAGEWQKWNWQVPFSLVPETFG